jgi:hypothetical protein
MKRIILASVIAIPIIIGCIKTEMDTTVAVYKLFNYNNEKKDLIKDVNKFSKRKFMVERIIDSGDNEIKNNNIITRTLPIKVGIISDDNEKTLYNQGIRIGYHNEPIYRLIEFKFNLRDGIIKYIFENDIELEIKKMDNGKLIYRLKAKDYIQESTPQYYKSIDMNSIELDAIKMFQ